MRVCCLFSGGKDSCYSLHKMLLSGFEIPVLLTIRSKCKDSWLYQTPGIEVSHLFSELTGIETRIIDSPEGKDDEQGALTGALIALKEEFNLDAICSGALLSDYQRMAFSHAAMDAGLISYTPIWRNDGKEYMRGLYTFGFRFILLSYASEGFELSDLGRVIGETELERLFALSDRWGSHPAFEGGEAETLVLEAPLYKKSMEVKGSMIEEGPCNARYVIEKAVIV
ncbi:MAG: diphthine--ammonia ligase [Candidatus Thermoplasmatota archaeon]|nr:diphthine--ammonia ligase [Candidatus Thermoplasmatota archaeon]